MEDAYPNSLTKAEKRSKKMGTRSTQF